MDDIAFGRLVKLARIRRGWRQADLANRAGVSRWIVSRLERGHIGRLQVDTVRAVAAALDLRVEVLVRARAIDLDRVLNARHSALAASVVRWLRTFDGWEVRPEVSFSEYGERGVVDLLCWHPASRSVLVVELKTELLEFNELLGGLDRKTRLAPRVSQRLGWAPVDVATALLVADSTTNRRRAQAHVALMRAALPADGRALVRWLKRPSGPTRALRFVPDERPGHLRNGFASPTRVRTVRGPHVPARPR